MPLSEVSDAVYRYLQPSASNIPNFGTLYQSLPKVANEADLFTNSFPGLGLGATIYMFFTSQRERRIALGGPPPPYGGGGNKWRVYELALLILFKSDLPETIDGQLAYNRFIDDLTARVQANRSAGTNAPQYGGDGTGTIFQWGEGDVNGGDDLQFEHFVPRTIDGGVTLFQSLAHLKVCEDFVNT